MSLSSFQVPVFWWWCTQMFIIQLTVNQNCVVASFFLKQLSQFYLSEPRLGWQQWYHTEAEKCKPRARLNGSVNFRYCWELSGALQVSVAMLLLPCNLSEISIWILNGQCLLLIEQGFTPFRSFPRCFMLLLRSKCSPRGVL